MSQFHVDLPPKFIYDKDRPVEDTLKDIDEYLDRLARAMEDVFKKMFLRVAESAESPTSGNLAKLDEDGQIVDSGVAYDDTEDAVAKAHTQNSDTYLDEGETNEVTAANAKDAVTKKHTQNTDTDLGTLTDDINFGNHQGLGFMIENRVNDTGCTQTGRIWFRTE